MKCSVLLALSLALISSAAVGQASNYGPPGISTTIPILQISPIVVTPPASTIPTSPSVNPIIITPPVTTIPLMPAVAPPIEPDPTTRMKNGSALYSVTFPVAPAAPRLADALGVAEASSRRVEDGTQGRSLGEIAREQRRCTPQVTGRTFANDDFERTPNANAEGLPKLVVTVCPADQQP